MTILAAPFGMRDYLHGTTVLYPPAGAVIGAAVSGVIAGVSFSGPLVLFGTQIATGLLAQVIVGAAVFVGSLALSALSQALAPEPPSLSAGDLSNRFRQIRQPVTNRRFIYGEARVSGPILFVDTTDDNKYLHVLIAVADHEVESFDAIYLDDDPIYPDELDSNGLVTGSNKYADLVRFKFLYGASGQAADSDLVAETSATSDYRFRGIAGIYSRFEFDRDTFPNGVPNVSAWVKGKKVFDTRDGMTKWTPNPSLCLRDYATTEGKLGGANIDASEINDDYTDAAANTSEEFVSVKQRDFTVTTVDAGGDYIEHDERLLQIVTGDRLNISSDGSVPDGLSANTDYYAIVQRRKRTSEVNPRVQFASSYADALAGNAVDITSSGSGTITLSKVAEPRYTLNGTVSQGQDPFQILNDMLSSMGGDFVHTGDTWKIFAAAYRQPVLTLDESDARAQISVKPKHSRRDRFNAVKGVYAPEIEDGVPTDYPAITDSTYEANDGGDRIYGEQDLPLTSRPATAQRLANIKLERHRQETRITYPVTLRQGLKVQPADVVNITNARFGWDKKPFEVINWQMVVERSEGDVPVLGIDLELRETAASVFDWSTAQETQVDVAPGAGTPGAGKPSAPSNVVVTFASSTFNIQTTVSWDAPTDQFVKEGQTRVQYKLSSNSDWNNAALVEGTQTSAEVPGLIGGADYDFRVRFISTQDVQSDWTTIANQTAPSPTGATLSTTKATTPTGITVGTSDTEIASLSFNLNGPVQANCSLTLNENNAGDTTVSVRMEIAGLNVDSQTIGVAQNTSETVQLNAYRTGNSPDVKIIATKSSATPDVTADADLEATQFEETAGP